MRIYILTNSLDYGDAVSTHCVLLKSRASELGAQVALLASSAHPEVRPYLDGGPELLESAASGDILLHQFFNESVLMQFVEAFPGRRVMMYHNITPPEYVERQSPVHSSCLRGLKQARVYRGMYQLALGMSEFSRRDLERLGYERTGVFPLFIDLDKLHSTRPDPVLMSRLKLGEYYLLHVGRLAPNKRIEDLIQLTATCRSKGADTRLILVGDDSQHPSYVQRIRKLAGTLGLREGENVVITGKVPDSQLVAYYTLADAYVCMSEHEGFCAPLIEAMSFGVPVFAYGGTAVSETLGGAGVVFREKNFDALADSVISMLQNPTERESAIDAQLRVVDFHRPAMQRQRLRSLFESLERLPRPDSPRQRVSVVINTLNRARELERCLRSLDRQTFRDFEVVVVQGPCKDDTSRVLEAFGERLRIVPTGSTILSVSRNLGIGAARGDLVAFIDDDAVAHPKWLEELVKAFDVPEIGAAGGLVFRMNGQEIEFRNGVIDDHGSVEWDRPFPGAFFDREEGCLNTVSGNNCIFRRDALLKIGGFDERIEYYHDEADVVIRLADAGFAIRHKPAAVVYHEAARSGNRKNKYELNWYAIVKNTLYCALKNRRKSVSLWGLIGRTILRIITTRMVPMLQWAANGQISLIVLVRMELAALAGIVAGCCLGLRPRPRHQQFSTRVNDDSFTIFPKSESRRMAVCLLSQSLPGTSPGGIATYTAALAKGLRGLGCEVHIVSRGDKLRCCYRDGIWYHETSELPLTEGLLDWSRYPLLAKNLKYSNGVREKILDIEARWGLDLVESPNWDFEGLLPALEHRHPLVVRAHSPLFEVARHQGWSVTPDLVQAAALERTCFLHADVVTGSTKAIIQLIEEQFRIHGKCRHVPLGLEVSRNSTVPVAESAPMVLFVGRLERRKGIHTLLRAIPKVLQAHPSAVFTIIGKDCQPAGEKSWQEIWQDSNRLRDGAKRVRFLGEVPDNVLNDYYEKCDVFVAPSTYESFGLIYVEAMARGKPVVACRVGGVPEVVLDGETGILVSPDNADELADAILLLLNDSTLREKMKVAAKAAYESRFTIEKMAERTLAVYQDAIRAWNASHPLVWRGTALDFRRPSDCKVDWLALGGATCLSVPAGSPRNVIHGPYIPLAQGNYRAEFIILLDAPQKTPVDLATLDVFSLDHGVIGQRQVNSREFVAGEGRVFDIYFSVSTNSLNKCEFRIHTTGKVSFRVREIVVRKWERQRTHSGVAQTIELALPKQIL